MDPGREREEGGGGGLHKHAKHPGSPRYNLHHTVLQSHLVIRGHRSMLGLGIVVQRVVVRRRCGRSV